MMLTQLRKTCMACDSLRIVLLLGTPLTAEQVGACDELVRAQQRGEAGFSPEPFLGTSLASDEVLPFLLSHAAEANARAVVQSVLARSSQLSEEQALACVECFGSEVLRAIRRISFSGGLRHTFFQTAVSGGDYRSAVAFAGDDMEDTTLEWVGITVSETPLARAFVVHLASRFPKGSAALLEGLAQGKARGLIEVVLPWVAGEPGPHAREVLRASFARYARCFLRSGGAMLLFGLECAVALGDARFVASLRDERQHPAVVLRRLFRLLVDGASEEFVAAVALALRSVGEERLAVAYADNEGGARRRMAAVLETAGKAADRQLLPLPVEGRRWRCDPLDDLVAVDIED